MRVKKSGTKFTLQFNRADPAHLQVAEILNKQGQRSKAQYIVNAVIHYENCNETLDTKRLANIDEKVIEAVVKRILHDSGERVVEKPAESFSAVQPKTPQSDEEISFDEGVDSIGESGFNAVVDALDMFRKRGNS